MLREGIALKYNVSHTLSVAHWTQVCASRTGDSGRGRMTSGDCVA